MTTTLYMATEQGVSIVRGERGLWHGMTCLRGSKVECVLADPSDCNVAYCGTLGEGLFRTADGGTHWSVCASLSFSKITALAADRAGRIYAGSEPSSLARSADGGETWDQLADLSGLPGSERWSFPPRSSTHHVKTILPEQVRPGELHVAIEAGALLRSARGGTSWLQPVKGAPIDTHRLLVHPEEPFRLFSAAGDGFFESKDNGETWQRSQDGLPDSYCWSAAISGNRRPTLLMSASASAFAAHYSNFANSAVYRREEGSRWQRVESGSLRIEGRRAAAIAAKPGAPGTFFLSTEGMILLSEDDGRSWDELSVEWTDGRLYHAAEIAVV